mmetsp:Transcript_20396/g.33497  ORF Transcript_20396/g.33497 Transcript_20396/m.33497 type:complete len:117 (+) Transcript_20396:2261-2611(+)
MGPVTAASMTCMVITDMDSMTMVMGMAWGHMQEWQQTHHILTEPNNEQNSSATGHTNRTLLVLNIWSVIDIPRSSHFWFMHANMYCIVTSFLVDAAATKCKSGSFRGRSELKSFRY